MTTISQHPSYHIVTIFSCDENFLRSTLSSCQIHNTGLLNTGTKLCIITSAGLIFEVEVPFRPLHSFHLPPHPVFNEIFQGGVGGRRLNKVTFQLRDMVITRSGLVRLVPVNI